MITNLKIELPDSRKYVVETDMSPEEMFESIRSAASIDSGFMVVDKTKNIFVLPKEVFCQAVFIINPV
jgi:hypothetical protein